MLSVGSIVSGAFRLVKERPGSVAAWGLTYLAATMVAALAMRPLTRMQAAEAAPGAELSTSGALASMGLIILVQLALFLVAMVLYAASQRAVLRPHEDGLGHLRLGADELRLIGLGLAFAFLLYVGFFVAAMAGVLLGLLAAAVAPGLGILVGIVGIVLFFGALVWLLVRLSLIYSLTFMRRRFVVGESWSLTSGHFWTLFGGYLVIFLFMLILWVATLAVNLGPFVQDIMSGGMQVAESAQLARELAPIDARTVLGWVLTAAAGALGIALGGGAAATATLELAGTPEEELASTFD